MQARAGTCRADKLLTRITPRMLARWSCAVWLTSNEQMVYRW